MKAGIRRGMNTLDNIHKAAKKEFLDKGFQMASLRNIVKNAGVTTGAFYGYYKSKEELFDALVGKQYEHIMKMYIDVQNGFKKLDANTQQTSMGKVSGDCMEEMLDEDIEALIAERQQARKDKNFARADEIRDELLAKGIVLKDTREGVRWSRA